MLRWLRRFRRMPPAPLIGAGEVRRIKTHSADSGYVYQYFYEGRRPTPDGIEYVFSVSANRIAYFGVSVVIADQAVESWQETHGRELSENERYGLAKMALRRAFDERPAPAAMRGGVRLGQHEVGKIAEALGLD